MTRLFADTQARLIRLSGESVAMEISSGELKSKNINHFKFTVLQKNKNTLSLGGKFRAFYHSCLSSDNGRMMNRAVRRILF